MRVKWTRLFCHDLVDNQVRLQLLALAYNLGNFLRPLPLPKSAKKWSLRTLREKLIKIRGQGGQAFAECDIDISDGRSGCAADALSGNTWPNPAVTFVGNTCGAGIMFEAAENRDLEWRSTVAVCPNSLRKQVLDAIAGPSWCFFCGRACLTCRNSVEIETKS